MSVSYPVNLFLVRRCPFRPVGSFEHVQKFLPDKVDRGVGLVYGLHQLANALCVTSPVLILFLSVNVW